METQLKKPYKEIIRIAIIVMLLLIAYIPNFLYWRFDIHLPLYFTFQSNIIYIGLFTAWGISVHYRIIQKQVRGYLIAISALIVFWIILRIIKYYLVDDIYLDRQLWYMYYVPMLLISSLSVLVAMSLRKPENYRLPKWTGIVMMLTVLLILMVLTNDLHQLTFSFPQGKVWTEEDYKYEIVYKLVFLWEVLTAFGTLVILIAKCRTPRSQRFLWLPFIPLILCVLYAVLYITGWHVLRLFARDITIAFCLLFTATLESCIRVGLIQSNYNYDELFRASKISARITDNNGRTFLSSESVAIMDKEILCQAQIEPVLFPQGIRLSSTPIIGGHFLWQENVAQLTKMLAELENINESLQGRNITLQVEQKTRLRRQQLAQQNRIYNIMQSQTKDKVYHLSVLLDRLENINNIQILKQIAVLTAYLKRRYNLIFLAEDSSEIPAVELKYCIRESVQSLTLFGISCAYDFDLKDSLPFTEMTNIYDVFETIIEKSLDTLTSLHLHIKKEHVGIIMTMILTAQTDLSELHIENLTIQQEDDEEWRLIYRIGGEQK